MFFIQEESTPAGDDDQQADAPAAEPQAPAGDTPAEGDAAPAEGGEEKSDDSQE